MEQNPSWIYPHGQSLVYLLSTLRPDQCRYFRGFVQLLLTPPMLALPTAYKQVGTYSGTVGDSHCHSVDGGPSVLGIRIPNSSRNAGNDKEAVRAHI